MIIKIGIDNNYMSLKIPKKMYEDIYWGDIDVPSNLNDQAKERKIRINLNKKEDFLKDISKQVEYMISYYLENNDNKK